LLVLQGGLVLFVKQAGQLIAPDDDYIVPEGVVSVAPWIPALALALRTLLSLWLEGRALHASTRRFDTQVALF
jgi:hypothetical protein